MKFISEKQLAYIIAIASHKGGVAKTVSSLAIATSLARHDKKTLLLDLDPQGHCSVGIGLELSDETLTLRHLFTDPPTSIEKIITKTPVSNLSIVPSDIRLSRVEKALYARTKREELLSNALQPVNGAYEFIIMDCPPSLGVLTEAGITAADFVIIPCQMEARASDGLVDLLEIVQLLKGKRFSDWRILLTRLDARKTVTNNAVMAQLDDWTDKILESTIPVSEPLNQAQIARTNIYDFDPKSTGALAYEKLTNELLSAHVQHHG